MNDRTFEPLPDRYKDLSQTIAAIEPSAIATTKDEQSESTFPRALTPEPQTHQCDLPTLANPDRLYKQ
jgi:hypothetical protein